MCGSRVCVYVVVIVVHYIEDATNLVCHPYVHDGAALYNYTVVE